MSALSKLIQISYAGEVPMYILINCLGVKYEKIAFNSYCCSVMLCTSIFSEIDAGSVHHIRSREIF